MATWIVFFGSILIGFFLCCLLGGIMLSYQEYRKQRIDMTFIFAWLSAILGSILVLGAGISGWWFLIEKIVR